MSAWVLILVASLRLGDSGVAAINVPFGTEAACLAAGKAIASDLAVKQVTSHLWEPHVASWGCFKTQ